MSLFSSLVQLRYKIKILFIKQHALDLIAQLIHISDAAFKNFAACFLLSSKAFCELCDLLLIGLFDLFTAVLQPFIHRAIFQDRCGTNKFAQSFCSICN